MKEDTHTHIGCDFIDAFNCRITSIQQVRKSDGKAIATISFVKDAQGLTVTRALGIEGVDMKTFKKEAINLMENSTPVTFRETKLTPP